MSDIRDIMSKIICLELWKIVSTRGGGGGVGGMGVGVYLGLTRSISWSLMPWHQHPWYWLCSSCLPWERISTACVMLEWRTNRKCKYMFMVLLKKIVFNLYHRSIHFLCLVSLVFTVLNLGIGISENQSNNFFNQSTQYYRYADPHVFPRHRCLNHFHTMFKYQHLCYKISLDMGDVILPMKVKSAEKLERKGAPFECALCLMMAMRPSVTGCLHAHWLTRALIQYKDVILPV